MNKKYDFSKIIKHLDNKEYSFDQDLIGPHCIDWRKKYQGTCDLIVFPKSIKNLSKVVKECSLQKISIIPQGGNTSLVGGSVPRKNKSEIIINLKNLNKIRKIDALDFSISVESGCILEDIQNEVKKKKNDFSNFYGFKR